MSRLNYAWKRFWYPLSADIDLGDGGYLTDPEGEYGEILNPRAFSLEKIDSSPCLVLLGEPGIGKSRALQEADATLKFDLGAFQSDQTLVDDIFRHSEMLAWGAGAHRLKLSLDSLDEGRIAIGNLSKILLREFAKLKPNVARLSLRISCRSADWPTTFEDGLRDLWGEGLVAVYQLAPLRRRDVLAAAAANAIDAELFLREIDRSEAVAFAIKPVTLGFLIRCFKTEGKLPATRTALYLEGCRGLCEESQERRDTATAGKLSPEARLAVVSRIAALTSLGGFSAQSGQAWNELTFLKGTLPFGSYAAEPNEPMGSTSRLTTKQWWKHSPLGCFLHTAPIGWAGLITPMASFWPPGTSQMNDSMIGN